MNRMLSVILLARVLASPVPQDTVRVMFWNVENFFAAGEFPGHSWSKTRFYTKCNAVAKTILLAGDCYGGLPDVIGFAEVGDGGVMKALVRSTPLRKLGYGVVHYDSPDRRGIDCALLYRRSRFRLRSSKPCHLYDSTGSVMRTRDILLAVLEPRTGSADGSPPRDSAAAMRGVAEPLAVLVNHHPSKVGAGSGERRRIAMARLGFLVDSLRSDGIPHIIAIGDFNDEVVPAPGVVRSCPAPARHPGPPVELRGTLQPEPAPSPPGTIKFQGRWERIDGCPFLEGLRAEEHIFAPPNLLAKDSYGGEKPRRTFSGPRYIGGISDHLPIFYKITTYCENNIK